MVLNACSPLSGSLYCVVPKASTNPKSLQVPHLPSKVAFSTLRSSCKPYQELKTHFSRGLTPLYLSASASPLFGHIDIVSDGTQKLPRRLQSFGPPRSSIYSYNYKFPKITERPRWWWRTLACLPYLMPFHGAYMFTQPAFNPHSLLHYFESFAFNFLLATDRLPRWFTMVYFTIAYLGIVRRKEVPHFIRFHLMMAMLLDSGLQIVGVLNSLVPSPWYFGNVGMYFWLAFTFAYLLAVLECMRCALAGKYPEVPFLRDSAGMHTPS